LLNNRIATNRNTSSEIKLDEHLAQLKLLYSKLDKYFYVYEKDSQSTPGVLAALSQFAFNLSKSVVGERVEKINPNYPREDYEEFIARIISSKKDKIERILEI
jgi:hypothetical protein